MYSSGHVVLKKTMKTIPTYYTFKQKNKCPLQISEVKEPNNYTNVTSKMIVMMKA